MYVCLGECMDVCTAFCKTPCVLIHRCCTVALLDADTQNQDRIADAVNTFQRVSAQNAFADVVGMAGSPALLSLSPVAAAGGAGAAAGSTAAAAAGGAWADLQLQYLRAYLDFYSPEGPTIAGDIARAFVDHPVPRWARKFQVRVPQGLRSGVAWWLS